MGWVRGYAIKSRLGCRVPCERMRSLTAADVVDGTENVGGVSEGYKSGLGGEKGATRMQINQLSNRNGSQR